MNEYAIDEAEYDQDAQPVFDNLLELAQKDPILFNLVLSQLAKQSLFILAKFVLGYSDITLNTHGPMINCLESDSKRKLICVPRGTFKSSIGVVAYSIFRLLNDPNERIFIVSELFTNSKNLIREIRSHLMSHRFVSVFGNLLGDTVTQSELTINTRTQIKKEASITAGGLETTKVGQHYSTIIIDDLSSTSTTRTLELQNKVIEHYRMLQAILEPDGQMIVIGTRYAENDLIGHILKNEIGEKNE